MLCNDGKYCCLGVLADVLGELDDRGWVRHNSEPYASQLPPELLKRCGLDAYDQGVLIELNDNDEASFTEIADYIEENL